jgi:gliding motility-associated transport system ATP-binding protein
LRPSADGTVVARSEHGFNSKMIEVQNLTRKYYDKTAVDDISFAVGEREIVGFLGPNGAGKTTTMRILTGFIGPTAGTVRIAGVDIAADPLGTKAAIGYLPETLAVYPEMKTREYLRYRASLERVPRGERGKCVDDAIDRCLLSEVADRKVENLSKGFRQRVGLAAALVHRPPILILDEPTVGLDPKQIIRIRELIRELGRERSVLLSTHILPEVDAVCDRVLIIDRGRIVAEGTPNELRQKMQGAPVVRCVIAGDVDAKSAFAALDGAGEIMEEKRPGETSVRIECEPGVDLREIVFSTAVNRGWTLRELGREAVTLEDVFVRLTTHEPESAVAEESGAAS